MLGVGFYAFWVSEVIPALAAGETSQSLAEVGLITNPVQVLDIGIVLPSFTVGSVALVRRRPLSYWLVPVMLAFAVSMDLALIGMDISMGGARCSRWRAASPRVRHNGSPQPDRAVVDVAETGVFDEPYRVRSGRT